MQVLSGDTRQKRLAIVKLAANQSKIQHGSSLENRTPQNTAEGYNFEETCSAKSTHMVQESEGRIKNYTKVLDRFTGRYSRTKEIDREITGKFIKNVGFIWAEFNFVSVQTENLHRS